MGFWWVGTGLNDETRIFAQGYTGSIFTETSIYAGDLEIHGVGLRTLGLRPQFSARSPQFGAPALLYNPGGVSMRRVRL